MRRGVRRALTLGGQAPLAVGAILVAMVANVQLTRLRERGQR